MDLVSQNLLLTSGGGKKSTYVEDVFSTYLYTGQSTTKTITNGIDNLGEGGMLWVKNRDNARGHQLYDTERLASGSNTTSDYSLTSNSTGAARDMSPNGIVTWKNDGWSVLGGDGDINQNGFGDYASWNFRKQKGFFDVVTYTGNGVAGRTIPHSLGCVPGMIIVKQTSASANWVIYQRDIGNAYSLSFTGAGKHNDNAYWNSTDPTASVFSLGNSDNTNKDTGETYVAYLFAGGASTAATSRSVDFDGSGDYLGFANTGSNGAYQLGTGDFTVEFWWKANSTTQGNWNQVIGTQSTGGTDTGLWRIGTRTNANKVYFSSATGGGFDEPAWDANIDDMQWHHVAITRASGYIYCYVDGEKLVNSGGTNNITRSLTTSNSLFIGYNVRDGNYINGKLSNVRIVKGTAVYTTSFNPIYNPLTDITNTTLLCCNNSSVTGGTVLPVVPTSYGNPQSSTSTPFDDPEGFKFGGDEDQNIIKCGSYIGNGQSTAGTGVAGPNINLGWEPQWIMVKCATDNEHWELYDSTRGIFTKPAGNQGVTEPCLEPNLNNAESQNERFSLTPTGFQTETGSGSVNGNGKTYIYICIRRPDGYVGKPAEAGTEVFNMAMGTSNSDVPAFVSGFVTNFAINRSPTATENWWTQFRLTGDKYVIANSDAAEASSTPNKWDYMNGWYAATSNQSAYLSWMWKRHASFDVVAYTGNAVSGRQMPHSMGVTPEMMWVKKRSSSSDGNWSVYHKGLNGGTDPEDYYINLNGNDAEVNNFYRWADTAPNSTHFTLGTSGSVNDSGQTYIAMLFASVDGISKCGSYDGTGYTRSISFGFQPRFLILRKVSGSGSSGSTYSWYVLDTTRGWGSGDDSYMALNHNQPAYNNADFGEPTSTGWDITNNFINTVGDKYIYYAHA